MKDRRVRRSAIALLVALGLCFPSALWAGAPTEAVRSTADRTLEILRDPAFKGENKSNQRREKLREVIYPRFDFAEMARRSLGSHWRQRTPEEQAEYVKLFTNLLENSYVDKLESYSGEKIIYLREREDKDFAEVDTQVVTDKGEKYSINYKLHKVDGEWKVYDIVIENISLVNNYRSQFDRVLSKSSFNDLLARLRSKQFQAPATKSKT